MVLCVDSAQYFVLSIVEYFVLSVVEYFVLSIVQYFVMSSPLTCAEQLMLLILSILFSQFQ